MGLTVGVFRSLKVASLPPSFFNFTTHSNSQAYTSAAQSGPLNTFNYAKPDNNMNIIVSNFTVLSHIQSKLDMKPASLAAEMAIKMNETIDERLQVLEANFWSLQPLIAVLTLRATVLCIVMLFMILGIVIFFDRARRTSIHPAAPLSPRSESRRSYEETLLRDRIKELERKMERMSQLPPYSAYAEDTIICSNLPVQLEVPLFGQNTAAPAEEAFEVGPAHDYDIV
ncbi:hypothetical protein SAICODRAFT_24017 [Saitoella complicata NRRL Y-17804]|uniref:uncharacterized protein n=1 Tax=Saitoella complicata (strain BCRC 22490 / CBS 7301 / JCM 7358 / NBRC 10748 / NRRL Y-17804) TaxID=698492 RepID=UPI000866CAC1|nr:uncharacterized protein SAICODRAFT_24017 [Saitoella complicata NRRL Y-17804]ODQ54774.1 hypothetical protein SAICODRAFT_24017 [Saitoella complicata NRRL Y-17804]